MGFKRQVQSIAISAAAFACIGGSAVAQQNITGVNDQSNLQHQRLTGTSDMTGATAIVTGRANNPNTNGADMNATLIDFGSGSDMSNKGPFVTMSDKQFARGVMTRGMIEIELSRIATERGASPEVKALGQRMLDDYTKWTTGMHRAANALGIKLPTELDSKQKANVDRISALSGAEFDNAYLKEAVNLQNKALTMAQYEAANAGVGGFRHFAGIVLPEVQDHLQLAKAALAANTVTSKK